MDCRGGSKGWRKSTENYFGKAAVNITNIGNFTKVPYKYKLTDLYELPFTVLAGAGVGQI
jgi:pectate lyase